jgi:hypothetical protein
MNRSGLVLSAACLVAGLGMNGQASAVTVTRNYLSHGTANCQSALPVFDGNIRKRPMALANEGTATAFVTCDVESINNSATGFTAAGVFFTNRAGTAGVTVNCSLVDGAFAATGTFPKASPAIAVGSSSAITWSTADNSGANFMAPAISCALPPGVDISLVQFVYPEDVGA